MSTINITPQDLKDAFKRLRTSIRRDNVWHVSVGEYKLENMDLLEHGRIVYRLSKNGEKLMEGNYGTFKKLMNE